MITNVLPPFLWFAVYNQQNVASEQFHGVREVDTASMTESTDVSSVCTDYSSVIGVDLVHN